MSIHMYTGICIGHVRADIDCSICRGNETNIHSNNGQYSQLSSLPRSIVCSLLTIVAIPPPLTIHFWRFLSAAEHVPLQVQQQ